MRLNSIMCNFESFRNWFIKFFVAPDITFKPNSEVLFVPRHFLLLGIVFALTIITYFIFRKKSESTTKSALKIVATILLVCEVFTRVSKLFYFAMLGKLTFAQAFKVVVPIHFCSLMVVVLIVSVYTDNQAFLSFSAVCGFFATLIYLLCPIEGFNANYFYIRAFNSVFTHSLSFITSVNLIATKRVKIDIKDMGKTFALLVGMVVYGFIMNLIFPGENYMFMISNPTSITFGKIPYQIPFALVVATIVALIYVVPYLFDKMKQKRTLK